MVIVTENLVSSISKVLLELRSAASTTPDEDYDSLIHKYDLIFVGKNRSTIYSGMLCNTLNKHFGIAIEHDELLNLIPGLCAKLSMSYEGMIRVEDSGSPNPPIAQYQINLF